MEPPAEPSRGISSTAADPTAETLLERFNRYFSAVVADTDDLVRRAQEIRYQVYCVEHKFENATEHPDGREKDEFDSHSVHGLLIYRSNGHAAGTARLVLPRRDALEKSFAIQRVVTLSSSDMNQFFPLMSTAEVSRFSISKQFRRRQGDTSYGGEAVDNDAENVRRSGPLMSLGLIQTLVRMSAQHGITHWCAVMEPKLLRMLATMAIHFEPIGAQVEYHGLRQPCYCHIASVLERVKSERPMFWEVLTDGGFLCGHRNYLRRPTP